MTEMLLDCLNQLLPDDNILTDTRHCQPVKGKTSQRQEMLCDFCGSAMTGVSYEAMSNGLKRCQTCATQELQTLEELSRKIKNLFGELFDASLPEMNLIISDACPFKGTEVNRSNLGETPVPTGSFSKTETGNYSVWVLNGISELTALVTLTYLYTLIWQSENWEMSRLSNYCEGPYQAQLVESVTEGMALWTAVTVLRVQKEISAVRKLTNAIQKSFENHAAAPETGYFLYDHTFPPQHHRNSESPHPFQSKVTVSLAALKSSFEKSERHVW